MLTFTRLRALWKNFIVVYFSSNRVKLATIAGAWRRPRCLARRRWKINSTETLSCTSSNQFNETFSNGSFVHINSPLEQESFRANDYSLWYTLVWILKYICQINFTQSQFAFAVNGDEVQMPPSMAIRWSHTPDFWMLLSILVNGLLPNWTDRVATPDFTTVYWVFDALLPFPTLASVGISITSYLAAIDKRYITRSDRHVP